jgi:hypothetical protein
MVTRAFVVLKQNLTRGLPGGTGVPGESARGVRVPADRIWGRGWAEPCRPGLDAAKDYVGTRRPSGCSRTLVTCVMDDERITCVSLQRCAWRR